MKVLLLIMTIFLTLADRVQAQQAEVVTFNQFEQQYLKGRQDTLYVLNFWATWCTPCVKELPYFEKVNADFKNKPVKVVLVSLDFMNQLDSRLNPFIKNRKLQSQVLLLNAPRENEWIPKVDERWSGAIPATLMIHPKSGYKQFYEKAFEREELIKTVTNNLKQCGI